MGKEEQEGVPPEAEQQDEERTGLPERERQDEEKARINRERQRRQGVISDESEGKEPEGKEPEKAA